ncbi:nucleoside-diphosphate sugar epimerase [Arenibacter certesii]|uniref:Oxidoreductase n=1 Tax=Arenibacter certesii TaxID=228955 RepID=A0A918MH48_9FLAO|nr:nucleoside-diphosphate sugar epimerase [Arenibacter certesii]GGW24915.1 oxidoreductase [Arenibacter certesii]
MNEQLKTAIILGATGLTGGILLRTLLEDDRYGKIKLFSRSTIGFSHQKLEEYLGDLRNLEQFKMDFNADEVFCCIGTTKAKTPDSEKYREIDVGIPVSAGKLCKLNNINTYIVISALGANPKSRASYNRLKGEMENAVLALGIPKTHFLRPSLIAGKRAEQRLGEGLANQFMKVLNFVFVGPLDKYKSIKPETIASAMVWLANKQYNEVYIESDQIRKLAAE